MSLQAIEAAEVGQIPQRNVITVVAAFPARAVFVAGQGPQSAEQAPHALRAGVGSGRTKRKRSIALVRPEVRRSRAHSIEERLGGCLKHDLGGWHVRVRGYARVLSHLLFRALGLAADHLLRGTLRALR